MSQASIQRRQPFRGADVVPFAWVVFAADLAMLGGLA
jgi:hypothetical protein